MPNTQLPSTKANPALLLIKPNVPGYTEWAAQLGEAHFCVIRAETLRDVYHLRHIVQLSIAVLSDTVGFPALRASAEVVRSEWPSARIVILGDTPTHLDDNLYDETAPHTPSNRKSLRLTETAVYLWCRKDDALAAYLHRMSTSPAIQRPWPITESDPTKAAAQIRHTDSVNRATRQFFPAVR